jgi:putative nucleotidyltransferase with HDIG domain
VLGILLLIVPIYVIRQVYQTNQRLEQANRDLLELMVKAIEARDPYTSGHSQRVSQLAALIAQQFGLSNKQVEQIRTAALLHDVGKIYEEYAPVLRKAGKLDVTERALMQTHAGRSAELVGTISAFRGTIEDAVRHHHERYDGSGYPKGLAGRAIPIGARIIMIADTVDAMTTDRPYRTALTYDVVIAELRKFAGTQFDPELVETFMRSPAVRALIEKKTGGSSHAVPAAPMPASSWRRAKRIGSPHAS